MEKLETVCSIVVRACLTRKRERKREREREREMFSSMFCLRSLPTRDNRASSVNLRARLPTSSKIVKLRNSRLSKLFILFALNLIILIRSCRHFRVPLSSAIIQQTWTKEETSLPLRGGKKRPIPGRSPRRRLAISD